MSEESSLDGLFEDDAEVEETEAVETGETVEAEVEVEAETEEVPPTPKQPIDPEEFKGYLDEREKRQNLEREIEELRKQQAEPQSEIDPFEDPQGFKAQFEQQIRLTAFEQDKKWMGRLHDDWAEAETWINEQIGSNLAVKAKLEGSESILDDAYQLYQDHKALADVAGAGELKSENEQLKARLAELESGVTESVKSKAADKPSLAGTTNSGGGVESEGDMTLEDLMGSDFNDRPK